MPILKNTDRKRRGSIAIETAILLPLFIIGILTIGYLLKFCMISEGVHHALTDESRRIIAEAAIYPYPVSASSAIVSRINEESRGEADNVSASRFLYRVPGVSRSGRAYTDLVAVSVTFDTRPGLPRIFPVDIQGERTALGRAFVGFSHQGPVKPFSEMEQEKNTGTVWVFPRAGERYHGEHCAYIENNPREVLLDKGVRNRFSPCELCNPAGQGDGTLVYCFEASGRAYHTGKCTIVDRYVIEIGQEDAVKQGYASCAACGGA